MPILASDQLDLLRSEGHKSSFFASFLIPKTLWTARINDGAITRGETSIDFDTGSGSYAFAAIEALQEVWVGTSAGSDDIGRLRIRSISSGDGGATGTVTVARNALMFADNQYLTFKHDYPMKPLYPFIENDGTFKKDGNIAYTDENEDTLPVLIAGPHRARFIVGGTANFPIMLSESYPTADGATIASYGFSVYPNAGVTSSFDTATGTGWVEMTIADDYWCKFTVTDSNGKTRIGYRWYAVHSGSKSSPTYPKYNFTLSQLQGDWERGGWSTGMKLSDQAELDEIPDRTLCIIWHIPDYGDIRGEHDPPIVGVEVGGEDYIFWNPTIEYLPLTGGPAAWDIQINFRSKVYLNSEVAPMGTIISLEVIGTGGSTDVVNPVVDAYGYIETAATSFGVASPGTIEVKYDGEAIASLDYDDAEESPDYYVPTVSFLPTGTRNLMVGYVRKDDISQNIANGVGTVDLQIETIDALLRNQYMFSVSLSSQEDSPAVWEEYTSKLNVLKAIEHLWTYHSTVMNICDVFDLESNHDGRAYAEMEEGNLYAMADSLARQRGIRAHVVCDKGGRIHVIQDVQLLPDDERAVLPIVAEILPTDRSGEITIQRQIPNRTAFVKTSGFSFDGTFLPDGCPDPPCPNAIPLCASAPGIIQADEGADIQNFERQVFVDQDHCNQIAGRFYAQINNPYPEIRLKFHGNYAGVLDVAYKEFWQISIASGDTIREIVLTDQKLIVKNVGILVDVAKGTIACEVAFEPEAEGKDGVAGYCMDEIPEEDGGADPEPPDDSGLGGALITGASVHYKPPTSSNWILRTSESVNDLREDPWWQLTQGSTASINAIVWRCGAGYIKRSTDAGDTWTDKTPNTDPPNDAGDSPAPTTPALTFEQIDPSWVNEGEYVFIATWQNNASLYRTWLLYTDDNGATYSWKSIVTGTDADLDPVYVSGNTWETNTGNSFRLIDDSGIVIGRNTTSSASSNNQTLFYIDEDGNVNTSLNLGGSSYLESMCMLQSGEYIVARSTTAIKAAINYIVGQFVNQDVKNLPGPLGTWDAQDPHVIRLSSSSFMVAYVSLSDVGSNYGGYFTIGSIVAGALDFPDWEDAIQFESYTPPGEDMTIFDLIDIGGGSAMVLYSIGGVGTFARTLDSGGSFGTAADLTGIIGGLNNNKPMAIPYGSGILVAGTNGGNVRLVTVSSVGVVGTPSDVVVGSNPVVASVDSTLFVAYSGIGGGLLIAVEDSGGTFTAGSPIAVYDSLSVGNKAIMSYGGQPIVVYNKSVAPAENRINRAVFTPGDGGLDAWEARGLGVALSREDATKALVTCWFTNRLSVVKLSIPSLAIDIVDSLGSCTEAELVSKTFIAYPYITYDGTFYLFGRMNNPYSLGNPTRLIRSTNGGSSYTAVSGTISSHYYVGAMITDASENLWAVICAPLISKLYYGSASGITFKSTLPFQSDVVPHGIALDYANKTVYCVEDNTGSIAVVKSLFPYASWQNITTNHGTSSPIESIEVL